MLPEKLASEVRLVRLPLRPDAVDAVRLRLARVRPGAGRLELAHELGDVRFATGFASSRRPAGEEGRWAAALAVFGLTEGSAPAIQGYTVHELDRLAAIPRPDAWPIDPVDWRSAEQAPLLPKLVRRVGLDVPFTTVVWPKVRVVDPLKPPTGRRHVPRTRELDAATAEQAREPSLSRSAAYGRWLQRQLPAATIDLGAVRITGEYIANIGTGRSFATLGLRLNGLVQFTEPGSMAVSLLRGVGRRRAYGCGLLALA